MIKNYLKSAWRNIARHKFISFVNIFGLASGLTCCLLIITYVISELSYDKFNVNAGRIYRITRRFYTLDGTETLHLSSIAPPFGPLLQNAFPGIQENTRILSNGTTILHYKDKLFNEENGFFAEQNFFDFFSLDVTEGDKRSALKNPYSLMMTKDVAQKYFGNEDPMNKTIILDNNKHLYKVTGIFNPFPANSHLHPDILMSFNTLKDSTIYGENQLETNFGNNSFYTYILLTPGYDVNVIQKQIPVFLDKYVPLQGSTIKISKQTSLEMQKLTDIHLKSHLDGEIEQNDDIKHVYIFSVIAIFILIIACINYMNLSTARSVLRAKEIGIKKAIGARRREIIRQFLAESVIMAWVAFILSFLLYILLLPYINRLSHLDLEASSLLRWYILLLIFLLPLFVGLLSGIYPALFLSSFIPVKVLKGVLNVGRGNISMRKVLVVLQFCVSIVLIIATIVVFQQLQFIQNKELGLNKDQILNFAYGRSLAKQYDAFKNEIMANKGIKNIARSSRIPSDRLLDEQGLTAFGGKSVQLGTIDIKQISADDGFIPTYGIEIAAGRNFSKTRATDSNNYVINEEAVKILGWKDPQDAIGQGLTYGGIKGQIIGVVKNFHFESLHQKILPMILVYDPFLNFVSIKIDGNEVRPAIESIRSSWQRFFPQTPFDFSILDQKFAQLYSSEQVQESLFTIFAGLAIFIACLGLFGLSAFTISQRYKEIGMRKVLGASVGQIVMELSQDFLILVLIAILISIPISWFLMNLWLDDFAFRVTMGVWVFLTTGLLAFIIAFATISVHAIKAASVNPIKSLRTE
ncbi:MAG TPA: ABC transporter permease [Puia sp.]|nr:ABC transporter permease [Puia sp.]